VSPAGDRPAAERLEIVNVTDREMREQRFTDVNSPAGAA
jgi:hypothetical protein